MKKIIITRKEDDVITNIVTSAETQENGLLVEDSIGKYIIANIDSEYNVYKDIETSDDIVCGKYKYKDGFVLNSNYNNPVDELQQLRQDTEDLKNTLDSILTEVIPSLMA